MQRFELSTTDTLNLTWEPLLIVRLAILKPYQYHTFSLRIPLKLDDDNLDLLKWEHLSWLRFARWRLIDCSPIRHYGRSCSLDHYLQKGDKVQACDLFKMLFLDLH